MTVETVVNLIDKWELLLMYRNYIDQCIDKFAVSGELELLSFDEWVKTQYGPSMEDLTDVIHLEVSHDVYVDPQMSTETKTITSEFNVRVPKNIISKTGVIVNPMELSRISEKLVDKQELLLATVVFNNDRNKNYKAYGWDWK